MRSQHNSSLQYDTFRKQRMFFNDKIQTGVLAGTACIIHICLKQPRKSATEPTHINTMLLHIYINVFVYGGMSETCCVVMFLSFMVILYLLHILIWASAEVLHVAFKAAFFGRLSFHLIMAYTGNVQSRF